ncbi:MAG: RNA-directed DNA polymerase [Anaerolineae bacterium]|nr:RNA-directed DNA polymerase [Anaerolineae bacterium]
MFNDICKLENLYLAFKKAQLDNHYKRKVCVFAFRLEENINRLNWELLNNRYTPQPYTYFVVHEPKPRDIAAPAFRDRVLQHSLVARIQPLFEKQFIYDAYACRVDKGTHLGAYRLKKFLMAARCIYGPTTPIYSLQCDIRKFFQSIAWDKLLTIINQTITCPKTRDLIEKIITTHNGNERNSPVKKEQLSLFDDRATFQAPGINIEKRVGLPIGNLTSQLFANIYLNELDHFMKDRLRLKWYGRYMDDFYVLHQDKAYLKDLVTTVDDFLQHNLELSLHPKKLNIADTKNGVPFVGYRVFYDHILVRGNTLLRMERNWRKKQKQVKNGMIEPHKLEESKAAIIGHLSHANTYGLSKCLFEH